MKIRHPAARMPLEAGSGFSISSLLLFLFYSTVVAMETRGTLGSQSSAQVLLTPAICQCVSKRKAAIHGSWFTHTSARVHASIQQLCHACARICPQHHSSLPLWVCSAVMKACHLVMCVITQPRVIINTIRNTKAGSICVALCTGTGLHASPVSSHSNLTMAHA